KALAIGAIGALLSSSSVMAGSGAAAASTIDISPGIIAGPIIPQARLNGRQPPTSAFCIANSSFACYAPQDIANQYNLQKEYDAGHNGAGQTIVIFDSFGSPTIRQDLATFDDD